MKIVVPVISLFHCVIVCNMKIVVPVISLYMYNCN